MELALILRFGLLKIFIEMKWRCEMSTPSAPYYHKTAGDTYHWETRCSKNAYPAVGWEKTNAKPNKEQCNECKGK